MAEYERQVQQYNSAPLPEPSVGDNPVVMAGTGAWKELFTSPQYRRRTWVLIVVWMLGYAGLIYGVGAFLAVYMVDHGATAHEVFLTIAAAYAALFVAFQINARLGEGVERRDVIAVMAMLFAACWMVAWAVPSLAVIAVCYIFSRIGTGLFLFNLYNYTAVAYPTRIRSVAFAWTDGLGHLGAWGGVTLLGPLYALGPNHLGWILWIVDPRRIAAGRADPHAGHQAVRSRAGAGLHMTTEFGAPPSADDIAELAERAFAAIPQRLTRARPWRRHLGRGTAGR